MLSIRGLYRVKLFPFMETAPLPSFRTVANTLTVVRPRRRTLPVFYYCEALDALGYLRQPDFGRDQCLCVRG